MTEAVFKKHLDAAEKSPKEIAAAVSGLSDQILRYKPSPEKWCVLEILGHLADVEIKMTSVRKTGSRVNSRRFTSAQAPPASRTSVPRH